jgi:hypothetical protein
MPKPSTTELPDFTLVSNAPAAAKATVYEKKRGWLRWW